MIRIFGTSHVSKDSLDVIDRAFDKDPDIIALELDPPRLEALMFEGKGRREGPIFIKLLEKMQSYLGKKTGLMPGEEMLYAYNKGIRNDLDVALIDQDIRVTVERLKDVRRKEKVKAAFSVLAGFIMPFTESFDIEEIPEEEKIQGLVSELEESFPGLYRVLLEERNYVMTDALIDIQMQNPDADIAVFMGAAHKKPVSEILEGEGFEVSCENLMDEV